MRVATARRATRTVPLGALAVALALRVAVVAAVPARPAWDGVIYARAAGQLARGEGYTQRSLDEEAPARPTAFYPVGYPAVLAALRMAGFGARLDLWLQALAGVALVPVGWALGRRLGGRRAGRYAAWLLALWPGGVLLSASYLAEPLFALGAGLALLPLAYARRRQRLGALCVAGVALGFVAYLRPAALPMAALAGLGLGALRVRAAWGRGWAARARAAATAGAAGALALGLAAAPLAPWAARNAHALGAPVLVSTNGGVNLLLGTFGEGGYGAIPPAEDCPHGQREVERDRCRQARALARIAADPFAWLARGALKLVDTFGHESAPAYYLRDALRLSPEAEARAVLPLLALCRLGWIPALLGALAGAAALRGRRLGAAHVAVLAPPAALAALHFVYIGGDRYHAAVMPMIAALAGLGLSEWSRRAGRGRAAEPSSPRRHAT